jgi:hypothetical protein
MDIQQKVIHLLTKTYASPVFGDSFGVSDSQRVQTATTQILQVAAEVSSTLCRHIIDAYPGCTPQQAQAIAAEIIPKAVVFSSGLTAAELPSQTNRLGGITLAIGLMYFIDQTVDRGDEAAAQAVEAYANRPDPGIVPIHRCMDAIRAAIDNVALLEDAGRVAECFIDEVLLREVRLQRLSQQYYQLPSNQQEAFLERHAPELAELMTIDAGFPSVSSTLYALYRQETPSLPPLAAVYREPLLEMLLQICNVVVRIADEVGDWDVDAGTYPEKGVFCINVCNQPHPALLLELYRNAHIDATMASTLNTLFTQFKNAPADTKEQYGEQIIDILIHHAKQYIAALPADITGRYRQYVTLCKRVLEIGYVNRMGDRALEAHG